MKKKTRVDAVLEAVSVVAILGMFGTVLLQITGRHFLPTAPSWTEELGRLLVVWLTAIGAGMALKLDGYRGAVEFIIDCLPERGKKFVKLVLMCVIGAFLLVMIYQSVKVILRNMDVRSSALNLPMSFFYLAVLAMALLLLWALCAVVATELKKRRAGKNETCVHLEGGKD